jgi:hypothetical protein
VIYQVAQGEDRIITLDLDFSDIRTCVPSESKGIIVLRMAMQDKESISCFFRQKRSMDACGLWAESE